MLWQINRSPQARRRWLLAMFVAILVLVLGLPAYWYGINVFALIEGKPWRHAGERQAPADEASSANSGSPESKHPDDESGGNEPDRKPSENKSSGSAAGRDASPADLSELRKTVTPALVTIRRTDSR